MSTQIRAAALGLALSLTASAAFAATTVARTGDLEISDAWIAAPPRGAPTAVAYLTIANRGAQPERLMGGSTPGVAAIAPHTTSMVGGVMRMRDLPGGLEIPAHGSVRLAPGGNHLMLTGLKRDFRPGQLVPVTLTFAHERPATLEVMVRDRLSAVPSLVGAKGRP